MFHVILHCVFFSFRRSYFISAFTHAHSNHYSLFHVIPTFFRTYCIYALIELFFISLHFYVFIFSTIIFHIYTFSSFANTSPYHFYVYLLCFTLFQCVFHLLCVLYSYISSLYFRLPAVYHCISELHVLILLLHVFFVSSNHFYVYLLCFTCSVLHHFNVFFYLPCVLFRLCIIFYVYLLCSTWHPTATGLMIPPNDCG